jgi:hypothetical protein
VTAAATPSTPAASATAFFIAFLLMACPFCLGRAADHERI